MNVSCNVIRDLLPLYAEKLWGHRWAVRKDRQLGLRDVSPGEGKNTIGNGGICMNVSCNVIQDLLPLYAEKLTSPDSNRLVEEHLTDCPECSRQLSLMQKAAPMPVEVDTDPLEKIRQVMRKRWVLLPCP